RDWLRQRVSGRLDGAKQEVSQRIDRIAAVARARRDFTGERVVTGEPAAIAGPAGIVDVELVLAQIPSELNQMVAQDPASRDAGLEIVIDLRAQRVAVETILAPAVDVERRGGRAYRWLDAEHTLDVEAQAGRNDVAVVAPESETHLAEEGGRPRVGVPDRGLIPGRRTLPRRTVQRSGNGGLARRRRAEMGEGPEQANPVGDVFINARGGGVAAGLGRAGRDQSVHRTPIGRVGRPRRVRRR